MSKLNLHVDSSSDDIIADLQLLIRQPSVSAVKQGLVECANVVASIMGKAGITTEIMHLYNKERVLILILMLMLMFHHHWWRS